MPIWDVHKWSFCLFKILCLCCQWQMILKVTLTVCSKAFTTKSPSVCSQWCNSISVTQTSCAAQAGRRQHSVWLEALWKICVFLRGTLSWLMSFKKENVLLNDLCDSNCLHELIFFFFSVHLSIVFCLIREEENMQYLCEVIIHIVLDVTDRSQAIWCILHIQMTRKQQAPIWLA